MSATLSNPGPNGSRKWGEVTRAGFQIVPDTLFVKQRELAIDQTDMLVLLNLNTFWWFKDSPPFARTTLIARRMGVTARTVQRSLKKLEKRGLIRRGTFTDDNGEVFPAIFLDGLVAELGALAKNDTALSARMKRSAVEESGEDEIPF